MTNIMGTDQWLKPSSMECLLTEVSVTFHLE